MLHLMVHSLYSNKEIFLRELISNASDAADKLRFEALSQPELLDSGASLQVRIDVNEKEKTITVSDNGIGMSRDEVISNLGTIAKSGTAQFLQSLSGDQQKDSQLIGQFGVGFYSTFIVADEVEVLSRKAGTPANAATRWKSDGQADYSVAAASRPEAGTSVTLKLKKSEQEFAEPLRLREIVKKYADHIAIPVLMAKPELAQTEPATETTQEGEGEHNKQKQANNKPTTEQDYQAVNDAKALWTRPRKEIKADEYKAFYQHISHDFAEPLDWSHNKVEGKLEYTSLLYLPARAPYDLWNRDAARGLKLYVQRVFIMDDAEQFLPLYLRFVKGVVDSGDISLNVSREILQQDPVVESMRSALTKRVLNMLQKLHKKGKAGDKQDMEQGREEYNKFWNEFGQVIKEGLVEDPANHEDIAGLLQFTSTRSEGDAQDQGLAEYISRMQDGQEKIYYLTADSLKAARNSPHLEIFRKKGIEVLLLADRIDEWTMSHLHEFDGKPFQDISRGDLNLGKLDDEADKEQHKASEEKFKNLLARIKSALADKVEDVRLTHRLTDSPACLAVGEFDMGMQMRKIMAASGQQVPDSKPVFEVNPEHPLVERLDKETDEERFTELVAVLFDQANLADERQLADPGEFIQRLNKLLLELTG